MASVEIRVRGTKEAIAKLNRVTSMHFDREFATVTRYLVQFFKTAPFATEGGVYGSRWAPLAPSTVASKARRYPGRGILVASGKMRAGFVGTSGPRSTLIRNTVPHFKYPQRGTSKMPARVSMKLDAPRAKRVVSIIGEGLRQRIARG